MFAATPGPRTGTMGRPRIARRIESAAAGPVIPYDVGATFRITGRPGNLVQDVINISTDGVFVAVGIGYGFEEDRERPLGPPDALSNSRPPTAHRRRRSRAGESAPRRADRRDSA